MSEEWELVSRNRKDKGKNGRSNDEPKVESSAKKVESAAKEKTKKPPQPQQPPQPKKKQAEPEKVNKKPKNLEQAISAIGDAELMEACETASLSDVARFLNSKIAVDQNDEVYSRMPADYPLSVVPPFAKQYIRRAIAKEAKSASVHHCLEFCLSSIAYSMVKDFPVTGYKLMVQFIADYDPSIFTRCTSKVQTLMASFQNSPAIGRTLLWAIGQGGLKNFHVGVRVWKECMLPMFELKNYYKTVADYLIQLLRVSSSDDKLKITGSEFLDIFSFIFSAKRPLPKDVEKSVHLQSAVLRQLYFDKTDSWRDFNFMEKLFDLLPNSYYKNEKWDSKAEEVLATLLDAFTTYPSYFIKWEKIQIKYLKQSSHVISFVEKELKRSRTIKQDGRQVANSFALFSSNYSEILRVKKNDEDIENVIKVCQSAIAMAKSKKQASGGGARSGHGGGGGGAGGGGGGFPWRSACFVLFVAVAAAAVTFDVQHAGSYEKSETAKYARVALEYAKIGSERALVASARGYKWLEATAPPLYAAAADLVAPYAKLAGDVFAIVVAQTKRSCENVKEFAVARWPAVRATVDAYAPGALQTVGEYACAAWTPVRGAAARYWDAAAAYLKTRVFVDGWAPEALQSKMMQTLNATRSYAADYYQRFYKHVDDYSKL